MNCHNWSLGEVQRPNGKSFFKTKGKPLGVGQSCIAKHPPLGVGMERFGGAFSFGACDGGMGMEGLCGGSAIAVVCVWMEAKNGGLGSRVGVCGGMGMVDFSVWKLMLRCGLDGEILVFRLRDATSGCRC